MLINILDLIVDTTAGAAVLIVLLMMAILAMDHRTARALRKRRLEEWEQLQRELRELPAPGTLAPIHHFYGGKGVRADDD